MKPPLILLSRYYDRVAALIDGRVKIAGETARCEVMPSVPASFRRMMEDDEVLAGEMSFGFQVAVAGSQDRSRFVAVPVFLSRSFRHGNVFVHKESPLESFAQLKGKRVALEEYAMTMGIWVRTLFQEAGVMPEDIHWVTARDPVVVPEVEEKLRARLHLERTDGTSIWHLLERGDVDAVIGRPPDYRDVNGGAFRRLLRDHWQHQRDYHARTGIFPTMHLLALRREAYEANPQIALDLYTAFEESKRIAIEDMSTNLNALTITLPMLEAHVDETIARFGTDWWPYGIARNRAPLETFTSACFKQGVLARPLGPEQIFCPNTLGL
jgi:4,5-dihydroxyphthalate decarboxylase